MALYQEKDLPVAGNPDPRRGERNDALTAEIQRRATAESVSDEPWFSAR
ncbi:MAG: hypothetical protein AAF671_07335 [Pseudomonadota bacterium]